MATEPITDRENLLQHVRQVEFTIPDLRDIFSDWPKSGIEQGGLVNLRRIVNSRLENLSSLGAIKSLQPMVETDVALLAFWMWPHAEESELTILAFLLLWFLTWDDEVDEPSGFVSNDIASADQYRQDTALFVKQCLQLQTRTGLEEHISMGPIIQSFEVIGKGLCRSYCLEQRERFFKEIVFFLHMTHREQSCRLEGYIPSLEQYLDFRMGTSAIYALVAAAEFANKSFLPDWVWRSKPMQVIRKETNMIISITNDILSLKKEIRNGCIDSLVPLIFATGASADAAVNIAIHQMKGSKERFVLAEQSIMDTTSMKEALPEIIRFIDVCKTNCTGNLNWSLQTARYGMAASCVHAATDVTKLSS